MHFLNTENLPQDVYYFNIEVYKWIVFFFVYSHHLISYFIDKHHKILETTELNKKYLTNRRK